MVRNKSSNPQKTDRREEILDGAERAFGRKHYHEATMDDIAEVVGVGKGTIYLYFASKEDLFLSAAERKLSQLAEITRAASESGSDAADAIRRIVHAQLDFFVANIEFVRMLFVQLGNFHLGESQSLSDIRQRWLPAMLQTINLTTSAIERGQSEGAFRNVPARDAAMTLDAMIRNCVFMQALDPFTDLATKGQVVETIFLEGMLNHE
ncbi:MAG: TetR/AcrR family transcriptional regulator [Candidatus Poribacteria bacterium]|nr:TetR/AcrR family transcriptional regulator [Candidatus Poribacteria bacterium]